MLKKCPSCKTDLIKIPGQSTYKCPNEYNCSPQVMQSIQHFASRKAMNISGLGESLIEAMVNNQVIKNYTDLYILDIKSLLNLDRMALKSSMNLINSIDKSKNISFDRFLYSLGIREVGTSTARVLAKSFSTIESLMNADKTQLEMIKDIGPIVGKNIYKFFKLQKNKNNILKLIKNGIHIVYEEVSIIKEYNNMTFVVTGVFDNYKRKEIEERIRFKGGNISTTVSKKTDALILGTNPGSKYQKALDLNIKIIKEGGLSKLL